MNIYTSSINERLQEITIDCEKRQPNGLRNAVDELLSILKNGHDHYINDRKILDQIRQWFEKKFDLNPRHVFDQLCSMYEENYLKYSLLLAFFYFWGIGIEENYKRSFELNKKAAEEGTDIRSLYELAWCYDEGAGACNSLARCYQEGLGTKQDNNLAEYWYCEAAATGDTDSQVSLARRYFNGEGVPMNITKGLDWITKAAEGGSVSGQIRLARCYRDAMGTNKVDHQKMFYWLQKAVFSHYNTIPEASHALSECYQYVVGTNKDLHKSISLYCMFAQEDTLSYMNMYGHPSTTFATITSSSYYEAW
ncbi:12317_t:CDS:2 [Ambispora gerdemannii]|uniref:12317_t:CDS:1 n=1 Tax=Ambispora gerdemannii TaxID=144530 RepID=A0A9N9F495_9GLOM|nr:12317_t:CDS:2 [Ambispora gerdemannii]